MGPSHPLGGFLLLDGIEHRNTSETLAASLGTRVAGSDVSEEIDFLPAVDCYLSHYNLHLLSSTASEDMHKLWTCPTARELGHSRCSGQEVVHRSAG